MNNYTVEQLVEVIKTLNEYEVVEIKKKDGKIVATIKSTNRATITF